MNFTRLRLRLDQETRVPYVKSAGVQSEKSMQTYHDWGDPKDLCVYIV